ncbi:hypothetical protein BC834DRAFT_276361 [Gloeopeniophorella convolvens]|nr:hypothetical protein BC834DRAFT_276361 [Gloeopeniophorella convolvens]
MPRCHLTDHPAMNQALYDPGRRFPGAQRRTRDRSATGPASPRSPRAPYPSPIHTPRKTAALHFASPRFPPPDLGDDDDPARARGLSVPELPRAPRLPPGHSHGARARFVSLPASLGLPRIDTECDRLERACGRTPRLPPTPHQVRGVQPSAPAPAPVLPAPKWPLWPLLVQIKRLLRAEGKDVRDYLEACDLDAMWRADVEQRQRRERERAHMARMRSGQEPSIFDENTHIFGVSLDESVLRAPATAVFGGYRHDLPLVVFLCVEELYRTGIYQSGLFRDLPNRQRHHELCTLFDAAPAFGEGMSLRAESTPDTCALLLTYLKDLPEPVLPPSLFNAFWNWCVRPSVKREDERARREQDEEEDARQRFFTTGQRPPRASRRALIERAARRAARDAAEETGQVALARALLRLLPGARLALLAYLCAFFTQVPLCPENGLAPDDIARIFGPPVFGGPVPAARRTMVWVLCRWARVSDGLLDAEPEDAEEDAMQEVAPVPEEVLEEEDEGETEADESRPQRAPWPADAKGKGRERSLEPGDSISQVPAPDERYAPVQADSTSELLPPHVFAQPSPELSPESQYSGTLPLHAGASSRSSRPAALQTTLARRACACREKTPRAGAKGTRSC